MGEARVERIVVVVPARDESRTVGSAVDALRRAADEVEVGVDVVVVANGCRDDTAAVARACGAVVLETSIPGVGLARATGCSWALDRAPDPVHLWIASTDADSTVPRDWLARQLAAATAGADLFLGTIALTLPDLRRHRSWQARYERRQAGAPHGHVHGANLGIRGSSYVRAGGFRDLTVHEDADLVVRALAHGAEVVWVEDGPVTTSARHQSRVSGGVGSDLARSAEVWTWRSPHLELGGDAPGEAMSPA